MPRITITIDVDEAPDRRLLWTLGPVAEQLAFGPLEPPMLQLTDSQEVAIQIAAVDKKGQPAVLADGSVVFTSSDANVAAVTANPTDQTKATVVAGLPGTCQIQVTDGALSGTLDITVVGGAAASLTIVAGTPTEQP